MYNLYSETDILEKIDEYTKLEKNWDGYGGIALTIGASYEAKEMLATLLPEHFQNISDLYPNGHGTLTIEWRNELNELLSVEIGNYRYNYFFSPSTGPAKYVEDGRYDDLTELKADISLITSKV